jgi:hypothetical protein
MTDTQRQKLRKLTDELGELTSTKVSAVTLSYMIYEALCIIAEEETPNLGAASMTLTDAMLKRMVETGIDPKTIVIKSQMKDGVYRTWVEQEEPEHIGTVKLGKPRPLEPPTADDDGWIPWHGGECPVDGRTPVEVRWRNGEQRTGKRADDFGWYDLYGPDSIVAYRIVKPAPLNPPPPDDMPCYVWEKSLYRGSVMTLGAHVKTWANWWPCFVPLDAPAGSVWALRECGEVQRFPPGTSAQSVFDHEYPVQYVFTVPPKEEV